MAISETALILAGGTAVLSIAFGIRVAMREATVGGTAAPQPDGGAAGGSGAPDVAGVIALPPLIFLGFLAAAAVLEAVVPLPLLAGYALARYLGGVALAVSGFALIGMGTRRFQAAGTNVPPSLPTTALVVDGIYTENPEPALSGSDLDLPGLKHRCGKPVGHRTRRPAYVGHQYRRDRAGRALSGAQVRRCVPRVQSASAAVDLILLLRAAGRIFTFFCKGGNDEFGAQLFFAVRI